jgi:hypothetical protein
VAVLSLASIVPACRPTSLSAASAPEQAEESSQVPTPEECGPSSATEPTFSDLLQLPADDESDEDTPPVLEFDPVLDVRLVSDSQDGDQELAPLPFDLSLPEDDTGADDETALPVLGFSPTLDSGEDELESDASDQEAWETPSITDQLPPLDSSLDEESLERDPAALLSTTIHGRAIPLPMTDQAAAEQRRQHRLRLGCFRRSGRALGARLGSAQQPARSEH